MSRQFASLITSQFARSGLLGCILLALGQLPLLAGQSVTLTWTPSPDTNAVGYKIYYGGASGVYTNTILLGAATSVTVSGLTEGATYYFSATTVSANGSESVFSNEATYVIPGNTNTSTGGGNTNSSPVSAPTLDPIASLTVYQNADAQTVNLTGISAGSGGNATVNVSVTSSDATIIPTPVVTYHGSDTTGTLTFVPAVGAVGVATITVTLDNGGAGNNLTSQTFTVTVAASVVTVTPPVVSQPPTLDPVTNLIVYQNGGLQTVPLTGIASGITNGYNVVTIWAYTSDASIIPAPTVNYKSPNSVGTLTFAPVADALGTATVTVKVNNGPDNFTQTFTVTVVPPPVTSIVGSQTPTVDPVGSVTVIQGVSSQNVTLTGITPKTLAKNQVLRITATSSNPRLIPAPLVRYSSPASTGTLILRPTPLGLGTATITLTLNNGGKSNNIVRQSFTVTVVPNSPPTLDAIANVTVDRNAGSQTVLLTGITSGSPAENQVLRVSAISSNPRLLFAPTVQYTSPANTAVLTFKSSANAIGVATVTVVVNDGSRYNNSVRRHFTVTVTPPVTNAAPSNAGAVLVKSGVVSEPDPAATLTTVAHDPGQFGFKVTGISGGKYVVQATSDLVHWISIQTNTAPFAFQEANMEGAGKRFYRALYIH